MVTVRDESQHREHRAAVEPGAPCTPAAAPGDGHDRWRIGWRAGIGGLLVVFLGPALVRSIAEPAGPVALPLTLAAAVALAAVFLHLVNRGIRDRADDPAIPWIELAALVTLAVSLAAAGGPWAQALALATFPAALHLPAVSGGVSVAVLSVLAGTFNWLGGNGPTGALTVLFATAVMGAFGYLTNRGITMSAQLRATEQELARMAAADERLRIARELHDLIGHSLSLIALKAELAQTLVPADADRLRQEIRDIESVSRRGVDDVRNAVTGYRRPDLAAELALARRTTAAAGIDCRADTPPEWSLPDEVDSLLAWSVREATTNVVRHSRARTCTIRLVIDANTAAIEVTDDGTGAEQLTRRDCARAGGWGLAGLAERASQLGGRLHTDTAGEHGFRLRVDAPTEPA